MQLPKAISSSSIGVAALARSPYITQVPLSTRPDPFWSTFTDAWLLDAFVADKLGGTGEKFNWELAVEAKKFGRPIFLAGGLTPANVADAVRTVQPYAVDVSSGVESAIRVKDPALVRAFVQAVREADEG